VHRDIRQIAEKIAASANARADVEIIELYDPLINNERVTARAVPVLERAADGDATLNERSGASEDMSFFLNRCLACTSSSASCRATRTWRRPRQTIAPTFSSTRRH
jgi:metal-dependent amidase/aminoacylase/carboxypeptidase family protein